MVSRSELEKVHARALAVRRAKKRALAEQWLGAQPVILSVEAMPSWPPTLSDPKRQQAAEDFIAQLAGPSPYVTGYQLPVACRTCLQLDDCRLGYCYDCLAPYAEHALKNRKQEKVKQ